MACKIPYIERAYRDTNPKLADRLNQEYVDIFNRLEDSGLFEDRDNKLWFAKNKTDRSKQQALIDTVNKNYEGEVVTEYERKVAVNVFNSIGNRNKVSYSLKSINILSSKKAIDTFNKGKKNNWDLQKILSEAQIPKDQQQIILDKGLTDREEIIASLLAENSFVVEVNTATTNELQDWAEPDENGNMVYKLSKNQNPTNYYSNLTVPGGTNYTENEIATPDITPNIIGHAQFSTDNGIGWFRSDDKAIQVVDLNPNVKHGNFNNWAKDDSNTRRILEVQSDLFQKGRDQELLTESKTDKRDGTGAIPYKTSGEYAGLLDKIRAKAIKVLGEIKGIKRPDGQTINLDGNTYYTMNGMWYLQKNELKSKNQFLQLLNKKNNWVTFFTKSIIQDSTKKGYEKVLFPKGDTAAKIEGHQTLEEFKRQKEESIKELEVDRNNTILHNSNWKEKEYRGEVYRYHKKSGEYSVMKGDGSIANITKEEYDAIPSIALQINTNRLDKEIKTLKQELADVEAGKTKLSSIANFYETTITNVLKKQGYNPVEITDEHGNKWNEVTIDPIQASAPILFGASSIEEMEFNMETLGSIGTFLESIGVEQRLVPSLLDKDGSVVEGALAAVNFLDQTVDILDDINTRSEAWNKLPEEAAHWWYRLLNNSIVEEKFLEKKNLAKIDKKVDELWNTEYKDTVDNKNQLREEAIGQLIAEDIKKLQDGKKEDVSFLKAFLDWVKKVLGIYKESTPDIFEAAAVKILTSDLSDLMSVEDYVKISNYLSPEDNMIEDENTQTKIDTQWYENAQKRFKKRQKITDRIKQKIKDKAKVEQRRPVKQKLREDEIQLIRKTNSYENIVPSLGSYKALQNKYKDINLNSPIKVDGAKKFDLDIYETVRLLLKEDIGRYTKSVTMSDFLNFVQTHLMEHYMLGFAEEKQHLGYRVSTTFEHDKGVTHRKISLRFNDEQVNRGSHFAMSPTAWGNITYFSTQGGEKDAVLLHEIQNDFFEFYQESLKGGTGAIVPIYNYLKIPKLFRNIGIEKDASASSAYKQLKAREEEFYNLAMHIGADISGSSDAMLKKYKDRTWKRIRDVNTNITVQYNKKRAFENFFRTKKEELLDLIREEGERVRKKEIKIIDPTHQLAPSTDLTDKVKDLFEEQKYLLDDPTNPELGNTHPFELNSFEDVGRYSFHQGRGAEQILQIMRSKVAKEVLGLADNYKTSINQMLGAMKTAESYNRYTKLSEKEFADIYNNMVYNFNFVVDQIKENDPIDNVNADKIKLENKYFEPLVHQLIQTIIKEKGRDFPIYFSGKEITMLTQGSEQTANIYAGKEEGGKVGAIFSRMKKIKGIKLEYVSEVPGIKEKAGGYKVDISNYQYDTPVLYGLSNKTKEKHSKLLEGIDAKIVSEKTIRDVAATMAARIGMAVRFESDRTKEYKGRIAGDRTAVINLAHATLDTPIHEIMAHPIIKAIKYLSKDTHVSKYDDFMESYEQLVGEFTEENPLHSPEELTAYLHENLKAEEPTLYDNLLKELEYGKGKEILDKVKEVYDYKSVYNPNGHIKEVNDYGLRSEDYVRIRVELGDSLDDIIRGLNIEYPKIDGEAMYFRYPAFTPEFLEDEPPTRQTTVEEVLDTVAGKYLEKQAYTLEEQQEEAIVTLLGLYTANRLDEAKDGKLISVLRQFLKSIKDFMRTLLNQREIDLTKLPDNMTIGDLADLLAYSNSKLIRPGYEVQYTTPDGNKYKTYQEASNHISYLAKSFTEEVEGLDNPYLLNNTLKPHLDKVRKYKKQVEANEKDDIKDQARISKLKDTIRKTSAKLESSTPEQHKQRLVTILQLNTEINRLSMQMHIRSENLIQVPAHPITQFIKKNKPYEQSKEIIEIWKKENNIKYNPEEIYSRGQGFYSVLGAYSSFDAGLLLQNILTHIEDNEKAGGEFTVSAFTSNIENKLNHIDRPGSVKFVIYPKSEDIKWAADSDVYSGSVWDASKKTNKDKSSELLGVSYTKSPDINRLRSVSPNLAEIVDNINHAHNELGIALTGNNFRLEYDDHVPAHIAGVVDNINSILDHKYGKIKKPNIRNTHYKNGSDNIVAVDGKITQFIDKESETFYSYQYGNYYAEPSFAFTLGEPDTTLIISESGFNNALSNLTLTSDKFLNAVENAIHNSKNRTYRTETTGGVLEPTQTKNNTSNIADTKSKVLERDAAAEKIKYNEKYLESFKNAKARKAEYSIEGEDIWVFDNLAGKDRYQRFKTKEELEAFRNDNIKLHTDRLEVLKKLSPKAHMEQVLINLKIDKLKSVAKKYPRSLIRSEVQRVGFHTRQEAPGDLWEPAFSKLGVTESISYTNSNNKTLGTPQVEAKSGEVVIGTIKTYNRPGDNLESSINVKESYRGKGIGTNLYLQLQEANKDKVVISSKRLTDGSIGVWDALVRQGNAIKLSKENYILTTNINKDSMYYKVISSNLPINIKEFYIGSTEAETSKLGDITEDFFNSPIPLESEDYIEQLKCKL